MPKTLLFFIIDEIPGERHCIHFPLLASVLASLRHEYSKFVIATWVSIAALLVSMLALLISTASFVIPLWI